MPAPETDLDTQDQQDQQQDDQQQDVQQDKSDQGTPGSENDEGDQDGSSQGKKQDTGGAEPFLVVNARTRYRTRDEALEAFQRAGERISELTPYAEIAEKYGITEPTVLEDIFQDYLKLRQGAQQQVRREEGGAAPKEVADSKLSQLSEKDRENYEYLKRLGFSPAEAFEKTVNERLSKLEQTLNEKLSTLEGATSAAQAQQRDAIIESGQSYLGSLLEEKGYEADPQVHEMIENAITNWIESKSYDTRGRMIPGSPAEKFMRGGRGMQDVVAEGLERVLAAMNKMRLQADGKYQDTKRQKVRSTPKVMPKGSQHQVTDEQDEGSRPRTPGAGGIFQNPQIHKDAWEVMQKARKG
jgi:hypothetical protein